MLIIKVLWLWSILLLDRWSCHADVCAVDRFMKFVLQKKRHNNQNALRRTRPVNAPAVTVGDVLRGGWCSVLVRPFKSGNILS